VAVGGLVCRASECHPAPASISRLVSGRRCVGGLADGSLRNNRGTFEQ